MGEASNGEFLITKAPQKKFQVHRTDGGVANKSFVINSDITPIRMPGTEREMRFAHQRNASDCGPCLVLNTLEALDVQHNFPSVLEVRQTANVLRMNQQRQVLRDGGWFHTSDVASTLESKGAIVEPFSIRSKPQEKEFSNLLEQKFFGKDPFVVYSGTGRHFKGIYFDGRNYYLLDSTQESIQRASRDDVGVLVNSAKASDRAETVGIVSKKRFVIEG